MDMDEDARAAAAPGDDPPEPPEERADSAPADDSDAELDLSAAAAIMQEARERALHELRARYPVVFVTWGLVLMIGYGVMWLSVLGQHPYTGPAPWSLLVLTLLVAAGAVTTVIMVGRALTGIGGPSVAQRRIHGLALAVGIVGIFALEGALAHAGASDSLLGVYGAVAPMLVAGVVYAASPAVWQDWSTRALGAWLVVVAASSGYAGPVGVWGLAGLLAGIGFFAAAVVRRGRDRP
jgi:hypothetical protein